MQVMKLTFFSVSHLAYKFFKVVATSILLVAINILIKLRQTKLFNAVSILDKLPNMNFAKRFLISPIQIEEW